MKTRMFIKSPQPLDSSDEDTTSTVTFASRKELKYVLCVSSAMQIFKRITKVMKFESSVSQSLENVIFLPLQDDHFGSGKTILNFLYLFVF